MHEIDAVKSAEQRKQIEAHLNVHGVLYADIWKVGVNPRVAYLGPVVTHQRGRAGVLTRNNLRFD